MKFQFPLQTTLTFWSQVAPFDLADSEACATWTGRTNDQGYGRIQVNGETRYAHRVAHELFHAPIPKGLVVRHRCHNPTCVRPSHLVLGTASDNAADREAAGRGRVHPSLSDADVVAIRYAYATGRWTQAELAETWLGDPAGQRTIGMIVTGTTRGSAGGPITRRGNGRKPPRRTPSRESLMMP